MADMNPHGPPEGHATTTMPTLPPELDRAIQVALQAAMAQLNSTTSQRFEAIENHVRHFTSTYESRLASAEHKHETTAPDPAPATVPVPPPTISPTEIGSSLGRQVRLQTPDTFSGKKGDIHDWLFQLELFFSQTSREFPTEMDSIRFAVSLLRGPALTWWRSTHTQLNYSTWKNFKANMIANYQPVDPVKKARGRLYALKQVGPVFKYNQLFRSIILLIPGITEEEKRYQYERGLKPEIRRELVLKDFRTTEEAMIMAERFDSAFWPTGTAPEGKKTSSYKASSYKGSEKPVLVDDPMEVDATMDVAAVEDSRRLKKLTPEERARCLKEGLCFRCRKSGHVTKDCPLVSAEKPKN